MDVASIRSLLPADSARLAGENPDHVRMLADLDVALPPIVVHRSTMRVIDGMHRLRAAGLRGQDMIRVVFFDGSAADAFVLSVQLNTVHGLPLSTADRVEAAARVLGSHPEWSNRRIAAVTGLAAGTVGRIRGRSAEQHVSVGLDGRIRPTDGTVGRQRAGELISRNPTAPLREIARAAGISVSTASDVRARLDRGESPITPRQQQPTAALANLRRDPSLRLTEAGRSLLRFLDVCAIDPRQLAELAGKVPPHQRGTVESLARECVRVWQDFADQLANDNAADTADDPGARCSTAS